MVSSNIPPYYANGRKKGYFNIEEMKDLWEEKGYGYLELKSQNLRDQAWRLEKMLQDCTRNKGNFSLADGNEGEPESSKREVFEENSQSAYQNNVPRQAENANFANSTAVASMRRTEALASVKSYQILSIFIFLSDW